MKKGILKLIIGAIFATIAVVTIFKTSKEIADLKEENEELRVLLKSKPIVATNHDLKNDHSEPKETAHLAEENEHLNEELNQLRAALDKVQEEGEMLQEQVDDLIKPFDEDILSSTLKTTVKNGEVLVTGGYQTADGRFQYAMVEPVTEQMSDGRKAIRMQARQYSMTQEVMKEFGLDTLSTNAGNTLQHGEVWTAEELRNLNERMVNNQGVDLMTAPQITVLPGNRAEIMIGEYKMSTTPGFLEDGSGYNIEIRIEQPRNP